MAASSSHTSSSSHSSSKSNSTTKSSSVSKGTSSSISNSSGASSSSSSTSGGSHSHTDSYTHGRSESNTSTIGGSTSTSYSQSLGGSASQSTGKSYASGQVDQNTASQRQQAMQNYTPSDEVKDTYNRLQNTLNNKPGTFTSSYTDQLNNLYDQIVNRKAFSYNMNADPMYQELKSEYTKNGKQAMQDTVGQASALTGGYANSYATSAGQQQYQKYLEDLAAQVPSLRSAALQEYEAEGNRLNNLYSLAGQQYNRDYQNYRDQVSDWNNDRNFDQSAYQANRNFDLSKYQADRNFWNQEYWNERNAEQTNVSNAQSRNYSNTMSNAQSNNWSQSHTSEENWSHTSSDTDTSNWSNTNSSSRNLEQAVTAARNAQISNSLSNTIGNTIQDSTSNSSTNSWSGGGGGSGRRSSGSSSGKSSSGNWESVATQKTRLDELMSAGSTDNRIDILSNWLANGAKKSDVSNYAKKFGITTSDINAYLKEKYGR